MSFISRIVDFTFSTTSKKIFNKPVNTYTFSLFTKPSQFEENSSNKKDYNNKLEFNSNFKSYFDILLNEYKFKSAEITKSIGNGDNTCYPEPYNFDNKIKTITYQNENDNISFNLNNDIKLNIDFNNFHFVETDNEIQLFISNNRYFYDNCYYPRYIKEIKNGINYYDTTNIMFVFEKNKRFKTSF